MAARTRIEELQGLMRTLRLDAWLVTSTDPHQSEYPAACWKARAWLSGFSGSAGTLVVTQAKAGLWVDPRYHLRAEKELAGSGIVPFKVGLPGVPSYPQWLAHALSHGAVVGFDGRQLSLAEVRRLGEALQDLSVTFSSDHDPVGMLWKDRPALPRAPIFLLDLAFAGQPRPSKLAQIREKMVQQRCQAHLISALDEIAWTLNLRGRDVEYNPVAISYLLITGQQAHLFIRPEKVPPDARAALTFDGVLVSEYEAIDSFLRRLPPETTLLFDPEKTSYTLAQIIAQTCQSKAAASIPAALKAVKNATELAGIRKAHVRDGVALVKWLYWLDQQPASAVHTEITLAERLAELRSLGENYQGLSFGSIVGFRANSAVGHYRPRPETTPQIEPEGILLVDSGAQYLDGTTDLTRTISLGSPSVAEKRACTWVLKSHIALAQTKFPAGTRGSQLDALARAPLWGQGWDCRHGIGHGIGHFLNVHEGPPRFRQDNQVPILPGMVLSNEPGVYFEGRFGIRIENVLITVPAETTEFGEFYRFETVSLCPIDLDLVEASLLTIEEKDWLNAYHQGVYETLAPFLAPTEQAWLGQETHTI